MIYTHGGRRAGAEKKRGFQGGGLSINRSHKNVGKCLKWPTGGAHLQKMRSKRERERESVGETGDTGSESILEGTVWFIKLTLPKKKQKKQKKKKIKRFVLVRCSRYQNEIV